ncbi:hypothetical protein DE146DRAFT_187079 [Phaeosphaeria sp. MPI-PUGE-AT-0046c]|nr:hypothetical protein DE146DRAFT_187079 [Phaeosphaeria sp. MPI-PUGE-AT-0046c]
MPAPSATLPAGARPYNALLCAMMAVISAAGAWFMRIAAIYYGIPVGFQDIVVAGVHPNGVPIKKNFTGLTYLDEGLSFLVTAFLSGSAGWNEAAYWQQFHFLLQFTTIVAITTLEACRERHQRSWLKYTALFAFLYQNIGGAVMMPLWAIVLFKVSGPNTYFQSGRTIPVPYARMLLPAYLVICLLPTIAMFIPGQSITSLQSVVAFWQLFPVLVNLPFWIASFFISSQSTTGKAKTADIPHLKIFYNSLLGINIVIHFITMYKIASYEDPMVTYSRVFIPDTAFFKTSMAEGVHWIFQWDWLLTALVYLIPAMVTIFDIFRLVPDIDDDSAGDKLFKGIYGVLALTVLGGPGAALAAIWGWREEQMVVMEERAEKEKAKKGL